MDHPTHVDVAVIGCGTMGSMALWHLTKHAPTARILGFEQYPALHPHGSYAGESRLFRVAVKEGPQYVTHARRAREQWLELGKLTGRDIFLPIGALSIGPADSTIMSDTKAVCDRYAVDHEVLQPGAVAERYPGFAPLAEGEIGILDAEGGAIRPELAVACAQKLALDAGARIEPQCEVLSITPGETAESPITITTTNGTYTADKAIVTAGSWTNRLLPHLADRITVKGIALTWYLPFDIAAFKPGAMPVFMRDVPMPDGEVWHCYGAPTLDGYSVKVSHGEFTGEGTDPSDLPITTIEDIPDDIVELLSTRVHAFIQGAHPDPVRITLHHDGFTENKAPIIEDVPDTFGRVIVAAGMSGNGMKFAPAYGEILATAALGIPSAPGENLHPPQQTIP